MATLNVTFAGICTHFRDVVPGVPHRVVLPDATALRFGYVHLPWFPATVQYHLLPHFAQLITPIGVDRPNVPGIIDDGFIFQGAHLKVLNAVGTGVVQDFDQTFSVLKFVPQYDYSGEVVFGGRAACYFDFLSGTVTTLMPEDPQKARKSLVTVETYGPPVLLVTPFSYRPTGAKATTITLQQRPGREDDVYELTIGNMDVDAHRDDVQFDFLLNYLTSRTGIPQVISERIPGLDAATIPRQQPDGPRKAMERLSSFIATGKLTREQRERIGRSADEITLACSDSRYP